MTNDRERWYVTHDGVRKSPLLKSENEASMYIMRHQGQSTDYAVRYGGWAIKGPYELQSEETYGTADVAKQEEIEAARVDAAQERKAKRE